MKKIVRIIAEAGVNHNGNIKIAKKMILIAKNSGSDFVKFQTFIPKLFLSKFAKPAQYQKSMIKKKNQIKEFEKFSFNLNQFKKIKLICDSIGIQFLSSPFEIVSINYLSSIGMSIFKIPSGEITNLPYLRAIGKLKKEVFLSTGMSSLKEIDQALNILIKSGTRRKKITIMQCNTEYPTPFIDVNLRAMETIKKKFDTNIGFSDHTLGIEASVAAVALGATVIEKHFTLNRKMKGPDHKASLEPFELKNMVQSIRNIELSLGKKNKLVTLSEKKNIIVARKSIFSLKKISIGEVFTENNITTKRPGDGVSPMKWDKLIGKKASKNYKEDDYIDEKV